MSIKRILLQGLLFAAFAVTPFAVGELSAQPQFQDYNVRVEKAQVSYGVYYGRPYYWRPYYYNYYRPYYYNYYYYPYRPYYYYWW